MRESSLPQNHRERGWGVNVALDCNLYLMSSNVSPYIGVGIGGVFGNMAPEGQAAEYEKTVEITVDEVEVEEEMVNGQILAQ